MISFGSRSGAGGESVTLMAENTVGGANAYFFGFKRTGCRRNLPSGLTNL